MNNTIVPQLYKPTTAEIVKVTESAKHRHPQLAARIDKARDILLDGSLQLEPVAWELRNGIHWRIASQSHKGAYIIAGLSCPCQDSRCPIIDGIRFCKHAIAVASYLKILRNHFNLDVRNRNIDLGILPNGQFHAYVKRMGYVQVAKVTGASETYSFITHADACHYSLWLAKQTPVVLPQMPASVALALAA